MDGFSTPDQFDDEALSLWVPGPMEQSHLDQSTAKYILSFIGDKFCQMVATENTASSWIKKDGKFSQKQRQSLDEHVSACFPLNLYRVFQPSWRGSEQWEGWGRCVTHVKPRFSTSTGSVRNVALSSAWTATRPRRERAPKVSSRKVRNGWTGVFFSNMLVYVTFLSTRLTSALWWVCVHCVTFFSLWSDKELYGWLKCVKGQPHDHKHLMPTQIIPGSGTVQLFVLLLNNSRCVVLWLNDTFQRIF